MVTSVYRKRLATLLTPAERRLFARLDRPHKVQAFLDAVPANFGIAGDTAMSPRTMLKAKVAHCSEGAVFAVAALAFHGQPSWLIDLRALPSDSDHIITVFKERGLWGAISKTNHPVLRWRDPVYRSPRELVMSYVHEYCLPGGKKSLLEYSRPFALTRYAPERWLTPEDDLDWLMVALDEAPHLPIAPKASLKRQRRSTAFERAAHNRTEWPDPRKAKSRKHAP
ncbi:MAG: hypothetical protein JSR61_03585 [Proteobacteria bacterium]|nr:hypothetical protein [Pseudomonadota bacterium]